jgi:SOS-response transcriptional repressor LexA
MSLGKKIRELREGMGWSQEELSRRAGLKRGHLSRLETDDYKRPSADTFLRLASALKVEPTELFEAAGYTQGKRATAVVGNGRRPLEAILKEAQERYELLETVEIPIVGYVPAGYPEHIEEKIEGHIAIPREYLGSTSRGLRALRAHGESLAGDDIHDGDILVVEPTPAELIDGKIYILRLHDEVVARHVYQDKDKVRLVSSKGEFEEIETKEVEILGRVILAGNWKKY